MSTEKEIDQVVHQQTVENSCCEKCKHFKEEEETYAWACRLRLRWHFWHNVPPDEFTCIKWEKK